MDRNPEMAQGLDRQAFVRARNVFQIAEARLPEPAVQALAAEVLARLERRGAVAQSHAPSDTEIEALCDALLGDHDDAAADLVLRARVGGMPLDTVYLGYLAGAARRLGERWDADTASSLEVTIGAGRIYGIMRGLRQVFVYDQVIHPDQVRALFAATPGETHSLGVTMAADYFRRRGWQIDLQVGLGHDELIAAVDHIDYPIIGLSASSQRMIFPLARLIVALRISNPGAWIMVSGKITELEPDICALVDADGVAADAPAALAQMLARLDRTPMQGSLQS